MRISDWSSDVCSSDLLDRRLVQMKIEENALQKESDKASKERLEKRSGEIKTLEAKTAELTAQWQAEKDKLAGEQKLKRQIDQARSELEIAQRNGDRNRASEQKSGGMPGLEKQPD